MNEMKAMKRKRLIKGKEIQMTRQDSNEKIETEIRERNEIENSKGMKEILRKSSTILRTQQFRNGSRI